LVVRRAVLTGLFLLALVSTLVAAGCGGQESETQADLVPASKVIGQFERETGRPLQRAAESDVAWDQLSYGLNPSPELLDQYGIFSVYVAKEGHLDALDSLLKDKATKKALERDQDGIYWELDSNSGTWIAYKRYGRNVVLVWFTESKEQAVDARWERLDEVLADLAR
jgi:hypothetical protein